jgi:transglutaminase-like putative cysteine protease
MVWRYEVEHRTGFEYAHEVHASYNEARISPLTTGTQTVVEHRIDITPDVVPTRYQDYWGTTVFAFDVHGPHTELEIVGRSVVDTVPLDTGEPLAVESSWDALEDPAFVDVHCELLAPTPYTRPDDSVVAAAVDLRAGDATPARAVQRVLDWIREAMRYETGSTTVHTTASEALADTRGVCQDFAHVTLAVLRSMGIPARYVSGYLDPRSEPALGEAVAGESHAWVEVCFAGEWIGLDPTNGGPAGARHLVVARGRDYADVPPLKGVYQGGPAHRLGVTVELTRTA